MRRDHHKLICERQRVGSNNRYHDIRRVDAMNDDDWLDEIDDLNETDESIQHSPVTASMRKTYKSRWMDKSFNDHITPIRGFIRKNVGRKWDDIFSEFCEVYDQRSVLTKHLFLHLHRAVERKLISKNDELYVRSRWRCNKLEEAWYVEYYVDPRDGILKHNEHERTYRQVRRESAEKKRAEQAKTSRVINSLTELHLINNTWFELKFAWKEPYKVTVEGFNTLTEKPYSYVTTRHRMIYDSNVRAKYNWEKVQISKRTLSKKELRDVGLRQAA